MIGILLLAGEQFFREFLEQRFLLSFFIPLHVGAVLHQEVVVITVCIRIVRHNDLRIDIKKIPLPALCFFVPRNRIEDEDIDQRPCCTGLRDIITGDKSSIGIRIPRDDARVIRIVFNAFEDSFRRRFFFHSLTELVELVAGHKQIDIVIPGDKPVVPDCPQRRAACQIISNAVFAADLIDLTDHFQEFFVNARHLKMPQLVIRPAARKPQQVRTNS